MASNIFENEENNVLIKKYGKTIKDYSFNDILEEFEEENGDSQALFETYLEALGWYSFVDMVEAWVEVDSDLGFDSYANVEDWLETNFGELSDSDRQAMYDIVGRETWIEVLRNLAIDQGACFGFDLEDEYSAGRCGFTEICNMLAGNEISYMLAGY